MKLSIYDALTTTCLLDFTIADDEKTLDVIDKYLTTSVTLSTMTSPREIDINIDYTNRYIDSLSTEQLVQLDEELNGIDTNKLVENTINKTHKKV